MIKVIVIADINELSKTQNALKAMSNTALIHGVNVEMFGVGNSMDDIIKILEDTMGKFDDTVRDVTIEETLQIAEREKENGCKN